MDQAGQGAGLGRVDRLGQAAESRTGGRKLLREHRHSFFSLHRFCSILFVINNFGNLLTAHGHPQSLHQTGVLIQF